MAQTDAAIRGPDLSPERIHELHRSMRRLRVGLELWARLVAARDRPAVAALAARLKRLARLVGEVRDRDIVLELLARPRPSGVAETELRRFHRFFGRLRDDARTGRELLRAFLTTEREAGFYGSVKSSLALPPRVSATRDLARLVAEEHADRHRKVDRAHRRATARPTSERLHRLRIRLRQFRHVSELARAFAPGASARVPAVFRRLQDRLGKLHDLDVALATLDSDLERSAWAVELRAVRRRMRSAARTELGRSAAAARRGARPGRRPTRAT